MQSPSDHLFSNQRLVFLASYPLLFTLQKSGEKEESRNEARAPLVGPNLLCLPRATVSLKLSFWSRKQTEHPPAGPHGNFEDHHAPPHRFFFKESDFLSLHTTQQHDMRTREGKSIQRGCGSADTMSLVIVFAASPRPLCVQTMGLVVGVL